MNVSIFAQAAASKAEVYGPLTDVIEHLCEKCGTAVFYIGDKGFFYVHAISVLQSLMQKYPGIVCREVMCDESQPVDFCEGVYPPEVMAAEPSQRQKKQIEWMIENCDAAIVYKSGVKSYYNRVIKEAIAAGKEIIYLDTQPGK